MIISPDGLTLEEITNDDIDENGQLKAAISDLITSIGDAAFEGCTNLTSITIPSSVTSIGPFAFYDCTSLTNTTIPNSVISIGEAAFGGCASITNITVPNSVTSIGEGVFYDCTSLTNITIPNSVTSISGDAFHDCTNLTSITIPNSVTSIGEGVFEGCTSLTNIVIASEDDEVIARIKALLPDESQDKVAPKGTYIKAKAIQNSALAVIENAAISPGLANALPPKDLHLLVAGYAAGEHVADQVKQAMQALLIPVINDVEAWLTYSVSIQAIVTQQIQSPQQAAPEAPANENTRKTRASLVLNQEETSKRLKKQPQQPQSAEAKENSVSHSFFQPAQASPAPQPEEAKPDDPDAPDTPAP